MKQMEVNISNIPALKTAMHIRADEEYQAAFTWIRLEAPKEGAERGRMIATDGFSLIVSEDAHDSPYTRHFRPVGKWKLPKSVESVRLTPDAMWIQRRNSGDVKRIEWHDGELSYPDVDRVIPADDAGVRVLSGPVDSIRGGDIAKAYGSKHGAWVPMPGGKMARLNDTDARDLVILVPLRDVEAWVTESEHDEG